MRRRQSQRLLLAASVLAVLGGPLPVRSEPDRSEAVRGIVRARVMSSISSDLASPVVRIGARAGEGFRAGDVLIGFDCRRHEAERAAAEATSKEAQLALENSRFLNERQAAGRLDVEIAAQRALRAEAELKMIEARNAGCTIRAPFDGRVAELAIAEHETPSAQRPVITVVDSAAPEIELIVPSRWLAWLAPGEEFSFTVDETGDIEPAIVIRVGAAVDPVSQSVTVAAKFARSALRVVPGMSGGAHFPRADGTP